MEKGGGAFSGEGGGGAFSGEYPLYVCSRFQLIMSVVFCACSRLQGDAYLASTGCIPHTHESDWENAERLARFALALQSHCDT